MFPITQCMRCFNCILLHYLIFIRTNLIQGFGQHDPFTYDAEGDFESYYERIKEVCDKWDVSYLDLYAKNNSDTGVNVRDDDMRKLYFGTESKPDGDGTHPNELGYQAIYVEPMIPWLKSL